MVVYETFDSFILSCMSLSEMKYNLINEMEKRITVLLSCSSYFSYFITRMISKVLLSE